LKYSLTQSGRVQMRQYKFGSALLMTMILVGCGGGGGDLPAKTKFTSQVSFGDSLSDVGSYKVPAIVGAGGGQFSINGTNANGKAANGNNITNWTEVISTFLGTPTPCAAATGGFGNVRTPHAGCYGYAQGGARVTSGSGIGNTGSAGSVFLGAMTESVTTQITNHLAEIGNTFSGNEIVFVMAGPNDVLTQLGAVGAGAISPASAVQAVGAAAGQLVAAVNTQILNNGAKHVVVVNVPDIGTTPFASTLATPSLGLLNTMVTTFNTTLKNGLDVLPSQTNLLQVDANTASHDETQNPLKYGLSDVAHTACDLSPAINLQASSLICSTAANNLSVGVKIDDHYLFADAVHPTPYGHNLFAQYVLQAMTAKGWH
jgi:phospholipase/lecithinase/hemolysin